MPDNFNSISPLKYTSLSPKNKRIQNPSSTLSPTLKVNQKIDIDKVKQRVSPLKHQPSTHATPSLSLDINKPPARLASPVKRLGTPKKNIGNDNKLNVTNYASFGVTQSVDRDSAFSKSSASRIRTGRASGIETLWSSDNNKYNNPAPTRVLTYRSPRRQSLLNNRSNLTPHSESRISKRLVNSRLTNSAISLMVSRQRDDSNVFENGSSSIFGSPISLRSSTRLRGKGSNSLLDKFNAMESNLSAIPAPKSFIPSYSRPTHSSLIKSPKSEKSNTNDNTLTVEKTKQLISDQNNSSFNSQNLPSKHENPINHEPFPKLKSCLKTKLAPPNSKFSIVNDEKDHSKLEKISLDIDEDNDDNQDNKENFNEASKGKKMVTFNNKIEELNQDNSITKRIHEDGQKPNEALNIDATIAKQSEEQELKKLQKQKENMEKLRLQEELLILEQTKQENVNKLLDCQTSITAKMSSLEKRIFEFQEILSTMENKHKEMKTLNNEIIEEIKSIQDK